VENPVAIGSPRTAVISFRVPVTLQHLIRAAAAQEGLPVAHLVERLVRDEVRRIATEAVGDTAPEKSIPSLEGQQS